jgi:hypothetical protein
MPRPNEQSSAAGPEPVRIELTIELATAFDKRDLATVAWDYLREVRSSSDYLKSASPAASMMRVIFALGAEDEVSGEKLEEAVVIGGAINGLPPITERGWSIAERVFEPAMLTYLRNWRPEEGWAGHPAESRDAWNARWASVKGDAGEVFQPLLWGDRAAGEGDMAGFIEHEDGTGADF